MGGFFKVFRQAFKIMEDFDSPCRIAGNIPTADGPGYFYQPMYPFGQLKSIKVSTGLQEGLSHIFPTLPK